MDRGKLIPVIFGINTIIVFARNVVLLQNHAYLAELFPEIAMYLWGSVALSWFSLIAFAALVVLAQDAYRKPKWAAVLERRMNALERQESENES